jgi:hypothetical protein
LWQCHGAAAETNAIDQAVIKYCLKTTVGAYDSGGLKNPKWDADARRSLETFARMLAWTNGSPSGLIADLKTYLSRLSDLKCDDPMIRYLNLRYAQPESRSPVENSTAMAEVAAALQKSQYPDIRKFYAFKWYRNSLLVPTPKRPEVSTLLETAASYLVKALDDTSMGMREADQTCDYLMTAPWWAEPTRWNCYRILEPALTNRWSGTSLPLLTKGRAYLSFAWQARGTGYADTVKENGWKLMGERLDIAAIALEAAWKLDSKDKRICREMMRVELGKGRGLPHLEVWFQRGMKLDSGDYDLCSEKLESLRPRWYGSIEEMIAFGR